MKELESFIVRSARKLKKVEPYASKLLFLTSFIIFSIENFITIFSIFGSDLFVVFVVLYFILFIVFIGSLPFYLYNTIKGRIPASKIRLYEMLSSLVLFIGSYVDNFIVGMVTIFIVLNLTVFLERGHDLPEVKKKSKFSLKDFNKIETLLLEDILKIRKEVLENLDLILKETREIIDTTEWDYEKFSFKRLEEYSNLMEELFLLHWQIIYLRTDSDMMFHKAKRYIEEGEIEEGMKLLRESIKNSASESESEHYALAKKKQELAVNLAKSHQYKEAYDIFVEILKDRTLWKAYTPKIVNFEILGEILKNLSLLKASEAIKEENYEILYNELGLGETYRLLQKDDKRRRIFNMVGFCIIIGLVIYILWYFFFK